MYKYLYFWFFFKYNCFTSGLGGKEFTCNTGDPDSIAGSGRSPGEGHGNPLQYSCLEDSRKEELGKLLYMGSQRVGHNWENNTHRDTHTVEGLVGHGSSVLRFVRKLHIVCHSGCINLHSYQQCKRGFPPSTLSPAFVVCRFFDDGHSDQCEVIPHCSFDLHFSNN